MELKIECNIVDGDARNYDKIYQFIKAADKTFTTPISERTDISKVTTKILEKAIVLQATVDHELVGLSSFYANDKINFISHWTFLAVKPQYTKRGIGSRLIAEMLSILKKEGMLSVDVLTDTVNKRARSLYEKLGFKLVLAADGRARYSYYLNGEDDEI